jgi:hypothetical protein
VIALMCVCVSIFFFVFFAARVVSKESRRLAYILLFAGLLARSQYASGRSCDRPSRHRFSWFSSVFKQMLRWFPSSKLLLRASHAALPSYIHRN